MKNFKLSERKNRNRTVLIGAGLVALLIAPIVGSASLEGGRFFIYAYNDQEPEINARAGLSGLASNPGGENPGNSLASTVTCGDQSITVTQAMLDFSDKNRKAVASGGSAENWPGGDWKFITTGSYYEIFAGSPSPIAMDIDKAYIFSNSPETTTADYIVPAVEGFQYSRKGGQLFQDISVDSMKESTGKSPSMIGALSAEAGGQTMELCSYIKFEGGKISSSNGPAVHTEQASIANGEISGGNTSGYLRSGMPAFGPDRPSIIAQSEAPGFSATDSIYFLESNGEEWDYSDTAGSLWHPTRKVFKATDRTVMTDWTDCFGDSCETRVPNPTISREITPANDLNPEITLYASAAPIHGATSIQLNKRSNGTVLRAEYTNREIQGGWENGVGRWSFSRMDGPARFSEDEQGNLYSTEYYVDGYSMANQTEYETAGGKQWQGIYQEGRIRE